MGRSRARVVLAMLLVNSGRLTPVDRLVDVLWREPPASARAQVHNLISSVRRRLGTDDVIVTHALGYELRLDGHQLDLVDFRTLVARGQQARTAGDDELALTLLGEALSLWRGSALADITDEWAEAFRLTLQEERLAAVEDRLDVQLALGRQDEALSELTTLINEHPYRESLYQRHMLALVAAGRGSDALATYRQAHERLVNELGTALGPALRDLQRRILRGELPAAPASVTTGPAIGARPPRATPALTGRNSLISEIVDQLRPAGDGAGGNAVLLVGPGGIGKTTVALAAAQRAAGAFPGGLLYADLRGTHDDPLDPHEVIGRFLRSMGVRGAELPDDRDERIALYRTHLAASRTLLVLDDAASEQQVRPLLPGTANCATLCTSRRQLGALVGAVRVTVPVLAHQDAVRLLARTAGAARVAAEPHAAASLVELCGHLPLAVCVAAARLAVHPEWTLAQLRARLAQERGRLDELAVGDLDVRATIALSYRALSPDSRRVFRRLGLVSAPDWPMWVAGELVGEEPDTSIERILGQLSDGHLIEPLGRDEAGQPRFRLHDLIADFARERAGTDDQERDIDQAHTRVLSRWLALATEADDLLGHGMILGAGLAAPDAPQAARNVPRQAPARWFEVERISLLAAVDQVCRTGQAELAGRLALRLAGFLAVRSYDDERERTLRRALAGVRAGGQDHLLVRLLGALWGVHAQQDRYAELPALATEELAVARRLGDRVCEFHALTHLGRSARMLDRFGEALRWLEEALRASRHPAVPRGQLARALTSIANVHTDVGNPEQALPLIEEAIAIERAEGGARIVAIHLLSYGARLTEVGRFTDAERALAQALEIAREFHDERGSAWIEHAQAQLDLRNGHLPRAAERLERSLQTQEKVGDREGTAEVLRSLGDLAAAQGRPHDAIEPMRRSLAIWCELGARLEQARTLAGLERALLHADDHRSAMVCRSEYQTILADLELTEACLRLPPLSGPGDQPAGNGE